MPFTTHHHAIELSTPETWQEIDFSDEYTGCFKYFNEYTGEFIEFTQIAEEEPELERTMASFFISSIGNPKIDKELRKKK